MLSTTYCSGLPGTSRRESSQGQLHFMFISSIDIKGTSLCWSQVKLTNVNLCRAFTNSYERATFENKNVLFAGYEDKQATLFNSF